MRSTKSADSIGGICRIHNPSHPPLTLRGGATWIPPFKARLMRVRLWRIRRGKGALSESHHGRQLHGHAFCAPVAWGAGKDACTGSTALKAVAIVA